MAKSNYSKPALTYHEQLEQLTTRGLQINNPDRAIHLLESISYYRLSGYWYPLLTEDKEKHIFKEGANFDNAFEMYTFDRSLRILLFRELEKIEITIRAVMIYILSHAYGPSWYSDFSLFHNRSLHITTVNKLREEYKRSKEQFATSFKSKYIDDLPPSWILLEVASIGCISTLYSNLKPSAAKRTVAKHFGLRDKVLASWIHSIVYLRNICAHHARLWNKQLKITPEIPKVTEKTWLSNNEIQNDRVYYLLAIILYLLQTINPKNTFAERFIHLLKSYPNIDVAAMGFPEDWQKEKLWS